MIINLDDLDYIKLLKKGYDNNLMVFDSESNILSLRLFALMKSCARINYKQSITSFILEDDVGLLALQDLYIKPILMKSYFEQFNFFIKKDITNYYQSIGGYLGPKKNNVIIGVMPNNVILGSY